MSFSNYSDDKVTLLYVKSSDKDDMQMVDVAPGGVVTVKTIYNTEANVWVPASDIQEHEWCVRLSINAQPHVAYDHDVNGNRSLYYGDYSLRETIAFLSISDIHMPDNDHDENKDRRDVLERILNKMKATIDSGSPKIRGVAIVGDSAGGYGKDSETDDFNDRFLNPLQKSISKHVIFIAPGNHDLYWDREKGETTKMGKEIRDSHGDYMYQSNIGPIAYICLGLYPAKSKKQYDDEGVKLLETKNDSSLDYLSGKLKSIERNTPIVIAFHYNIEGEESDWWSAEEKASFRKAINGHNVIAILVGHHHGYSIRALDGTNIKVIRAAVGTGTDNDKFALITWDPSPGKDNTVSATLIQADPK